MKYSAAQKVKETHNSSIIRDSSLTELYFQSLPPRLRDNKKRNFFYQSQLTGMQTIKAAWDNVSVETIKNCYNHTNLFDKEPFVNEQMDDSNNLIEKSLDTMGMDGGSVDLYPDHENLGIKDAGDAFPVDLEEVEQEIDNDTNDVEEVEEELSDSSRNQALLTISSAFLEYCIPKNDSQLQLLSDIMTFMDDVKQEERCNRTTQTVLNTDYFKRN